MYDIPMIVLLFLTGRDDDEEQAHDEFEAGDASMDLSVTRDWPPIGLGL